MWGDLVAAFAQVHPEIQVKREYTTTRYEEKIQQLLLADEAPDIILFQDEPMPRFISSGKFAVLDEYLERHGFSLELEGDYWKTAVVSFQQEGRTYAIPIWGGNCLIIYNRAAFREAGVAEPPPQWSVEEFIETCRRISADSDGDGRMERYGFLVPNWVYWLLSTMPLAPPIWMSGGRAGPCGGRKPKPKPLSSCGAGCVTTTTWHRIATS